MNHSPAQCHFNPPLVASRRQFEWAYEKERREKKEEEDWAAAEEGDVFLEQRVAVHLCAEIGRIWLCVKFCAI